ncbi:hypothetical protein ACKI2N_016410 [Cupriavidus sp. 30B13]|uniref:hypothetical protein n=1 Tax=Cupriavidus sp. 30B13 TaxID=3384241 RepID=UPI003B914B8C
MRQSSLAVAFVSVPRRRHARAESARAERRGAPPAPSVSLIDATAAETGQSACSWIRLRLAVASSQVFALRQSLHAAIGKLARIYVVEVDHRHGETTVHVEVERGGRDAAMHAIMMALPAAEFGVTTPLGQDHAAH